MQRQSGSHSFISTRDAATRAGVTVHTIRRWIEQYPGLGVPAHCSPQREGHEVRQVGRWRINASVLESVIKGLPSVEIPTDGVIYECENYKIAIIAKAQVDNIEDRRAA